MKTEIKPQDTTRAQAFELWMSSPMPMVTLVKTLNVTRLRKYAKRHSMTFNMALCWCIGKAANQIEEFFTIPEQGKLYRYDRLIINVIVSNAKGGINSCDIPFSEDLCLFQADYQRLTSNSAKNCQSSFLEDYMIIGTSAMTATELDCIVNQYTLSLQSDGYVGQIPQELDENNIACLFSIPPCPDGWRTCLPIFR